MCDQIFDLERNSLKLKIIILNIRIEKNTSHTLFSLPKH